MANRRQAVAERKAARERIEAAIARAREVVATGTCPDCGTTLRRNNAIAGWWECGARPCEDFRLPEHKGLPRCSFQTFTEV